MGGCGSSPKDVVETPNPMQEHGRQSQMSTKAQPAPARPPSSRNGGGGGGGAGGAAKSAENQMVSQIATARIAKARQRRGNVVNETIDAAEETQGRVSTADHRTMLCAHGPPSM